MRPDAPGSIGRLRMWYPAVPSTMEVAMALALRGAPHGTLVETAYQSAGRGRMGRPWVAAPSSSLLTSWVLRAPAGRTFGVLSPLVALALIRAVQALAPGAPIEYKWPNDVLIGGRKLAGVLLTARATSGVSIVIAGIGVNVTAESVPPGERAACLAAWAGDITVADIRNRMAGELETVWASFVADDGLTEGDSAELESRMAWRDEVVELRTGEGGVIGRQVGLDRDGALRLCMDDGGETRSLHVGEIVRGPRAVGPNGPDLCRILP